jgi:hypothetical protein
MADIPIVTVPVNLPADIVARIEELKQDREDDRNQSVEEIVRRLCQDYVTVREMARQELGRMDEINRSYEERPSDWDDAAVWETHYRQMEELK